MDYLFHRSPEAETWRANWYGVNANYSSPVAMQTNRSAPSNTTLSHVFYEDVGAAIDWLTKVFQFEEYYRYGPPDQPQGGQISLGKACVQLATVRTGRAVPNSVGVMTQMTTVFLEDVRVALSTHESRRSKDH